MKIKAVSNKTDELISEFLDVWEASVRATHDFLVDDDIKSLKPQVLQGLSIVSDVVYMTDEHERVSGFMAVEDGKIEMLFIHPAHRGTGLGKKFISHAITILQASRVDVNEQNIQGLGFYKHMGFKVANRSPLDGSGNPFPILHMTR